MPSIRISRKRVKIKSKTTKAKVKENSKKIQELIKEKKQETEYKIQPLRGVYNDIPKNQQGNLTGPLYYYNACLGKPAVTWLGPTGAANFQGLDGFTWDQGVLSNQRVGRYLFFRHTTMNMRLNMISVPNVASPTQFRVIVFKAKRNAAFGTSGGNPNADLFINNSGDNIGVNVSSAVDTRTFEFMNMLTNKRNYNIIHDKKVILQPTLATVTGGSNVVTPLSTKFPPEVTFNLKLPHNEKVSFAPGNFQEPQDLNYQYCVQVIAAPYGSTSAAADDWRISFRGTVSAIDG